MEKILKYLFKGHIINATMNVSFKSITDTLDFNIFGRWNLCSHLYENVIQQLVATFHRRNMRHSSDKNQNCWLWKSADRVCWQNVNLLTRKICWHNLKSNLLTTKKPCRLKASKPLLKTSHHASQAMAGAHIPSVKFNSCICAWAGPSFTL